MRGPGSKLFRGVLGGGFSFLIFMAICVGARAEDEGRSRVIDPLEIMTPEQNVKISYLINDMWEKYKIDVVVIIQFEYYKNLKLKEIAELYDKMWIKRADNRGQVLVYYDRDLRQIYFLVPDIDAKLNVTDQDIKLAMRAAIKGRLNDENVGNNIADAIFNVINFIDKRQKREFKFSTGRLLMALGFMIIFIIAAKTVRKGAKGARERGSRSSLKRRVSSDIRFYKTSNESGERVKWWWGD